MAYKSFIPKFEWLKGTLTGTIASGSPVVTGIANTDAVKVGLAYNMFFEGAGIPAAAVVLSKTSTTVTLDKNATANATNTFSFGFRVQFELPPKGDPLGENPRWAGSVSTAKSGATQYIEDYIEIEMKLSFSHVSQAIKDKFDFMLKTHVLSGNSFSYFREYAEPASEIIVEKNDNYVNPGFKVLTRKGAGFNFLWEFKLEMRKVYGT